jgi:hypothetical protein
MEIDMAHVFSEMTRMSNATYIIITPTFNEEVYMRLPGKIEFEEIPLLLLKFL